MSKTKSTFERLSKMKALVPVLVVGVLLLTGAVIYNFSARAATAGFTFTSGATSYKVGDTVQIGIYENSESQCTNVVQADFDYPTNLLQYQSIDASGSKFESAIAPEPGSYDEGDISIVQYTSRKECGSGGSATSGVSGNQLIATVRFTVKATGTAALNFQNSSIAVSSSDNESNVAPASTGLSLTLTAGTGVTPPPPGPTAPPPPPPPATPVTTIKPKGASTGVPLTNNDILKVTTPVTIQPATIQPDGVTKIEYLLDGKVVATVTEPPFSYELDTKKVLNGSYTLTTKKYYSNGTTEAVSQTLVIDNGFSFNQVMLRIQKSAWLIVLVLLVVGAALLAMIIHRRAGPADYYGAGGTITIGDNAHQEFVAPDDENSTVVHPMSDESAENLLKERSKAQLQSKAPAETVEKPADDDGEAALRGIEAPATRSAIKHKVKVIKPIK